MRGNVWLSSNATESQTPKSDMEQKFCLIHSSNQNIKVNTTHPIELIIISTEVELRFKKGSAIKKKYNQQNLVLSRKT